jgi:histidyl-tRNA synthetase
MPRGIPLKFTRFQQIYNKSQMHPSRSRRYFEVGIPIAGRREWATGREIPS